MSQLTHDHSPFEEKRFPITLILNGVTGPANIGSLFRLADAFNIEKVILCGPATDLESNRLKRTARSTIQKVNFEQQESVLNACSQYAQKGYALVALEITRDSIPLASLSYKKLKTIALIVGNETSGIDEDVLQMVHKKVHIEMFGRNSSMNVAQATGIALYEMTKSLSPV